MTKTLKWRLSKLPTPEELTLLVEKQILTKEDAKKILLSSEEDRDKESLEAEIKFLRQLVEKLSNSKTQIIETIRTVEPIYIKQPWYQPYYYWTSGTLTTSGDCGTNGTLTLNQPLNDSVMCANYTASSDFTDIKTF